MAGAVLTLSARLEFSSLDELEASFADRVNADALFLARSAVQSAVDDLEVGTQVHLVLTTAQGELALDLHGVVAWAYPLAPRTPPGREAGTGLLIDTVADDATRARLERMRRRPGAGGRVRAPGARMPALRLTRTTPPTPATTLPPQPAAPPPLPPSLFASILEEPSASAPAVASPPPPTSSPVDDEAPPLAPTEIVVAHPPVPQPRVMAMGLLVDQSFDPTPVPQPLPLPREESDVLPPPPVDDESSTTVFETREPALSLESLPDAPADAPPAARAFEQVRTDVDLLQSLDDADFFPAELEEKRRAEAAARAAPANPALHEETLVSDPDDLAEPSDDDDVPEGAPDDLELLPDDEIEEAVAEVLDEATGRAVAAAAQGEHAPPARPARALEIDDEETAAMPPSPATLEANDEANAPDSESMASALDEPTSSAAIRDDSTGETPGDALSLPSAEAMALQSMDSADFETAEHTAVGLAPALGETEHGDALGSSMTAEATASDEASPVHAQLRPLPTLAPFDEPGPPDPGPIGKAFMVSHKRGGHDPVVGVEAFTWPRSGTKRWNAVDIARETGDEAALDAAVTSGAWATRDPSAPDVDGDFETGMTDPGVNVADVVAKSVALAQEEEESVFSDAPAVRPAMRANALVDEPDGHPAEHDGDSTIDEGLSPAFAQPAGTDRALAAEMGGLADVADLDDATDGLSSPLDDAGSREAAEDDETERTLSRPPSKASPEAQARLKVLQRFLGKRE